MEKQKNKFHALTPEILSENKKIYTEALDFAFSNNDVKNIAITGIYGSGKSTVWNTYVYYKGLKNLITVSLGEYKNHIKDDNLKKESLIEKSDLDLHCDSEKYYVEQKKTDEIDEDNRVERQLINQILSQIDSKKIPLSKYRFKSNKSKLNICLQVLAFLSIICSILLWIVRDTFISFVNKFNKNFDQIFLMFLCAIFLIVPLFYYLYVFYRGNKFRISKISFKGTEANVYDNNNDESILDRDIKELVYLLRSSGTKIVVFEDLDRYNNISIYIKLRELNFILNHYVRINGDETPVRFVYMLKDGLFFSKDRTKFFDFILPIVPVVDSKTSENELVELFKTIENAPDNNVLADIALYVDDMRLLKNIVNEYIVYSKFIPLGAIELEKNKLFALLTLKNIFPNEFDLLQEDKGFVRALFDKLDSNRQNITKNLKEKIQKINEKIEFINNRIENDKFDAMALIIPVSVKLKENKGEITMSKFLKEWSESNTDRYNFFDENYWNSCSYNYEEFINKYVLANHEKSAHVDKFPKNFSLEMSKLNSDKEDLQKQIKNIDVYSYKELISTMTIEKKDELFSISGFDILENHYFSLIRFLIVEGLLDETYWYYKGNFNVDRLNTLKRNDIIYMKGLKEGKKLDIFLDVETPIEIIKRLKISDFSRANILNKKVLKYCLEQNLTENLLAIADSVDANDKYEDLIKILNEFDLKLVGNYSNMLLENKSDKLIRVLSYCDTPGSVEIFNSILITVLTNKTVTLDNLVKFKKYIEENENIVDLIPDEKFEVFIDNIQSANFKFKNLSRTNCDKKRLKSIEKIKAYELNVKNLIFIAEVMLEKTINYGSLLNEIYKFSELKASKKYIEENFSNIVSNYIDENKNEINYNNDENILFKILASNISDADKLKYVDKNDIVISNLSELQDCSIITEILDRLMSKNKVKFCLNNIVVYLNIVKKYSEDFNKYLDNNLNKSNEENILKNNVSLCNDLINDSSTSDKVFEYSIKYANTGISTINSELPQNRINTLIKCKLIEITKNNIEVLLNKSYYKELILLANDNEEAESVVINTLLEHEITDELVYCLVNSNISVENSLKLIDTIKDKALIERINSTKKSIIEAMIKKYLSAKNANYICKNFKNFELKKEFIEALDNKEDILKELEHKNISKFFMKYILNSSNIGIAMKVLLIKIMIINNIDTNDLKEYISSVSEISSLSTVWDNKRPLLDNEYKKNIAEALINSGYVYKYGERIIHKAQKNDTV
ncbi:hypothetical protein [Mycoplasmopsis synoviae]|uniref:YobI family P-loop NTPase n=1 Tax=Mycoplasmopsis synoviae TaxID=2109 RepID=UPI001CE0AC13|nr:hypothetical protein [Mycoplasmopsis synoviae]UBX98397.1 hypothetical protein K6987_01850 [Mycoplasmopsis synoviae]